MEPASRITRSTAPAVRASPESPGPSRRSRFPLTLRSKSDLGGCDGQTLNVFRPISAEFCLTFGKRSATVPPMGRGAPLRVGVIGAGFIGAVHARSALLAGGRVTGVAASSPRSSEEAAARIGAERAFESAEALVESPDVDVVHICTPNHLHVPLALAALQAGKHVICEKPLALDEAGASRARGRGRRERPPGSGALRLPLLPDGARGPRARARRARAASLRLLHGTYLQDWLSLPADDNWRVDDGARRRLAGLRRHRVALVRPGRVHLGRSHHAALRADGDGAAGAQPRRGQALLRPRRRRTGRPAACTPRTPRSSSSRPPPGRSARWS